MSRALALAWTAPEPTSPNPTVGAAVVADGEIVGEGVTEPPPGRHAEVVALEQAGERARGATLYVTLEPCRHFGRTPPCTEAIIAAGIPEVHYAVADPGEKSGGGHAVLEAAGIRVSAGEGEAEARRINEAFFKNRESGLPFVIGKFAASLDGRIAAASGDSRWVSGPEAREWSHRLRTRIDAIICGSETIVVDDPLLTARPGGCDAPRQPLRVVVDSRGRVAPMARVFTFAKHGDHVDLEELIRELAKRDVVTALVEGGGVLLGGFFDRGLVDKVHAVIAPLIVGAADAPGVISGQGAYRMADALRLREITVERLGEDILVTGYPHYPDPPD
ncbi:MAG: bifunctional diaminohydroxyphosphoribosylaminopyrimidine deaminase/5-amino-6-(5-phosphoribosylamino)uracil reductase RibD [Chloroflexi bacterium]|nr:MAG: bifunctional diaminohydroxyphosphoribosylaminopyrimidine deaminase/5-amino-6-(5-phosphoribosylamino)uracil reductase RibD [Chloroflexota bacterium]